MFFLLFNYVINSLFNNIIIFNRKVSKMTLLEVSLIKLIRDDVHIYVNVGNFVKIISIKKLFNNVVFTSVIVNFIQ